MKKEPLDAVKMLAEIAELEKSREVADSILHLTASRERLALLEEYLNEYSDAASNGSTDIERLRSQRTFIGALAQAIGDQGATIAQNSAVLEQRIETWRTARANSSAVGKLTEKRAKVKRERMEKLEQAELDAAGQRRQS